MAKEKPEINLDPVTSSIQENIETVVPTSAVIPSESTDAEERMKRYKRIHRYVSLKFGEDWDMNATMGRLGFGYREDV